jgi:hypothetical protein
MNILNVFLSLEGDWSYTRVLHDRYSFMVLGSVQGKAFFKALDYDGSIIFHYTERGILVNSLGQTFKTSQEYIYSYESDQQKIKKYFSKEGVNTGLFYVLDFNLIDFNSNSISANANHLCIKDNYQAYYEFPIDLKESNSKVFKEFKLVYEVTGSAKNYISTTLFKKYNDNY